MSQSYDILGGYHLPAIRRDDIVQVQVFQELAAAIKAMSDRLRKQPHLLGGLGSSMLVEIGHVEAIFRYPVKSMAVNDLRSPSWAGTA